MFILKKSNKLMQQEMTETLVGFKVAELAKKKGFIKSGIMMGYVTKFYRPSTQTLLSYGRTGRSKISDLIYAPTQGLLQKWLREIHNIHICGEVSWNTFKKKELIYEFWIKDMREVKPSKIIFTVPSYLSYEEALEFALFQALKLLPDEN